MADDDVKDAPTSEPSEQSEAEKPASSDATESSLPNGEDKAAAAAPLSKPPEAEKPKAKQASAPASAPSHGHGGGAAAHAAGGDGHGHGLAHTMPVSMLVGVLGALMALTILTVAVTSFDLGAQANLVVAMVIATVKAGLVVAFFMHLVWDKKLHLILFLTSVLFLVLFLSLAVNDRGEYQPDIENFQKLNAATK